MTWDAELDARGLLCPLPVLRARKRLEGLAPGAVLRVLADDPAARIDFPHFCARDRACAGRRRRTSKGAGST